MSEEFKVEIVNPEKSFLSKEDVTEVVIPAFEGEKELSDENIEDQRRFLISQKIDVLKSINSN